jgi:hypothetical protein
MAPAPDPFLVAKYSLVPGFSNKSLALTHAQSHKDSLSVAYLGPRLRSTYL